MVPGQPLVNIFGKTLIKKEQIAENTKKIALFQEKFAAKIGWICDFSKITYGFSDIHYYMKCVCVCVWGGGHRGT